MRIALSCVVVCVMLGASHFAVAQPKYGVTVRAVDAAGLAKVRTYVWTRTQPSFDKTVDALIVAAVDRELAARGLKKLASGQSDVEVTYSALSRTDVDTSKGKDGARPESEIGTLVVDMKAPASPKPLFTVRMDTPIKRDPATLEATINGAVKAMFEKYPVPPQK